MGSQRGQGAQVGGVTVAQARGDDSVDDVILLGCPVEREQWLRGDTTLSLQAA